MMLERYIVYHNTKVGEQMMSFDEGEEKEVLAELKALGKAYFVYDKKEDKDYTYSQFKKRLGIRDSFDNEKEYRGIKYSFYRGIYRIELEKKDYVYCESEKEVFDIIDAYLRDSFKMRSKDSDDIDPKNIFNIHTTGCGGYYDDLLNGIDADYYKDRKNVKARIDYMTPEEYYKESTYIFNNYKGSPANTNEVKRQRKGSITEDFDTWAPKGVNKVEYLKKCLQEGKKMNIAYLDYKNGEQEGLHRMMAVGDIVGWDVKFPVLIIEPYHVLTKSEIKENIEKWMKEDINKEDIYNEDSFANKVWDIIWKHNKELDVQKIKVEIRFHSMTIWLNYYGEEYSIPFSLRDPDNIRNKLFNIVEYKEPGNLDQPFDDLNDDDILKEDPNWNNYDE